jgi:alkylhydroperoxidase/carboxymuconolactone decarboxylase family protein YurZ
MYILSDSRKLENSNLTNLDSVFVDPVLAKGVRELAPSFYQAVDHFWHTIFVGKALSPRMKELVLLALHAASSALNSAAIDRHAKRALAAGASETDIIDVLVTIVPLANHPLYVGIPILLDELKKAGHHDAEVPPLTFEIQAIKDDFIAKRGYWTELRDLIGRLIPEYFMSFINACMEPWRTGSLTPKERELIYVAIDCSISHTYEPGMRMHIKNALRFGATRDEILGVFQLASLLGAEGYVLGALAVLKK